MVGMTPEKREELINALKSNRTYSKSGGSGARYWNSAADTVERTLFTKREALGTKAIWYAGYFRGRTEQARVEWMKLALVIICCVIIAHFLIHTF